MNQKQEQSFSLCAETEDEKKILKLFEEAFLLRRQKNKMYGDAWRQLGMRGEFSVAFAKMYRLKSLVWDKKEPVFEGVQDNLFDIIVYCFHMLVLFDEEKL